MADEMSFSEVDGAAALSICEALLIALIDARVVSGTTVSDLLSDVIATHKNAAALSDSPERHQAIVRITESLMRGKNIDVGSRVAS